MMMVSAIDLTNYDRASYLALYSRPTSASAHKLVDELYRHLFPEAPKRSRGRPKDTKGRKVALAAIVADILDATRHEPKRWVYRTLASGSFSQERIKYRPFVDVIRSLEEQQFLHKLAGFSTEQSAFGPVQRWGRATRWQATDKLFHICDEHDVTGENLREHFHSLLPSQVLVVRGPSVRMRGDKLKGKRVKLIGTAVPEALEQEIIQINRYLLRYEIGNAIHRGFQRFFGNCEDIATYQWNHHGRLYSIGEGNYQTLKKAERLAMTIDGHKVVEIDIKASHLTVFHSMVANSLNYDFDPTAKDPYSIRNPKTGKLIPRDVVKAWCTKTFGAGKLATSWSQQARQDYCASTSGMNLSSDYPAKAVRDAVIAAYPAFEHLEMSGIDSMQLMFIESQIIIGTMLCLLREHDIPCLPVHDSIIVPDVAEGLAAGVLTEQFRYATSIHPSLELNRG